MKSGMEMFISLNMADDEAGGCGFSLSQLDEMTVLDLFARLATNHVRFYYDKKSAEGRIK